MFEENGPCTIALQSFVMHIVFTSFLSIQSKRAHPGFLPVTQTGSCIVVYDVMHILDMQEIDESVGDVAPGIEKCFGSWSTWGCDTLAYILSRSHIVLVHPIEKSVFSHKRDAHF